MNDNTKKSLITLGKSIASALLVFVSSILANFFGGSVDVVTALSASVATGVMLS